MTYDTFELQKFTCDRCGKQEQQLVSDDLNVIEFEQSFIAELKSKGWTYDKESDEHFCPECSKRK